MQPDATVVIAAYNSAETVADAIDSALAQRGICIEVVVVDDASQDRTAEIASAYCGDAVRVLSLERNRGPGGARNEGIRQARGRWIAVLDSDDAMRPDRLERMIGRAERAGAGIAVDNLEVERRDADIETMFEPATLERIGELSLARFVEANRLFASTFNFGYMKPVFSSSFLAGSRLLYDETLRIGEDYVFLASALARGARCVVEPSAGYIYRVRDGSISRVLEPRHVTAMLAADEAFTRAHSLDAEAQAAFGRRARSLRDAASFLELIGHLKARAPLEVMRTAIANPAALRHLRMPIAARIRRIKDRLAPRGTSVPTGFPTA